MDSSLSHRASSVLTLVPISGLPISVLLLEEDLDWRQERDSPSQEHVPSIRCSNGRRRGRFAPTTANELSTMPHAKIGVVKSGPGSVILSGLMLTLGKTYR